MSIEKFYGQYTPHCDYCEKTLPGEFSFADAIQAKQDAGWERRKVDGEWLDICDDCIFEEKGY